MQAVVLAVRPPITIPRTTVSVALLEELLGEIPLLASVYHKPAETFVGRGRIGADSVQRKGAEYVPTCWALRHMAYLLYRFADDRTSTQKALQTVAQGQVAENLLDFSDDAPNDGQPSGLAATTVLASTPAAANLLAGTSSNPLDDLVSIFGSTSFAPTAPTPAMNGSPFGAADAGGGGGFGRGRRRSQR